MEKQKLIKIILKEIAELNEIAADFDVDQGISKYELDIAISRARLIHQELEFLNELNGDVHVKPTEDFDNEETISPAYMQTEEEAGEPGTMSVEWETVEENVQVEDSEAESADEVSRSEMFKEEVAGEEPAPEEESEEEIVEEQEKEMPGEENVADADQNRDDEKEPVMRTVGEHFVKGKSLNDLMTEQKTLDRKLADSPINSLEHAIGLNDRFQYTRELFDNNPDLFRTTIRHIDSLDTLPEAVAYLNTNFKWKKTDTSIQFAQLIKRRFSN